MAGLLDSARDFERWLAAIEAQRPISHPHRLDPEEMYRIWLQQQMEEDRKMMDFIRQPAPYEKAQLPGAQLPAALSALSDLSAMSPQAGEGPWGQPRLPWPRPGQQGFDSRLAGAPLSRNLEDRRMPSGADTVANWLRNYGGQP